VKHVSRRHFVALAGASLALAPLGLARAARLAGARLVHQDTVTLHVDLDAAIDGANLFTLEDPPRLVIDLPGTQLGGAAPVIGSDGGVVSGVRFGQHDNGALRLVVDLRRAISPSYRFVPRGSGQRLLVDLGVKGDPTLAMTRHRIIESAPLRDAIVAIDAGHGGKDPGAIGQRQTREKDVVLKVAQRLQRRLIATHGITPVMTRDDDRFVGLRDRLSLARAEHADLFVSIHADAFKRRSAHGSSVYTLSHDGASSEAAAWLAKSENESAALFGDISLEGLDQMLGQVLLDLAQNGTAEASIAMGAEVLGELQQIGAVHKPQVEQANFAVLKSPDIPSVLVETAFISNLQEERKLNDARFQDDLATAIGDGVTGYLTRRAPVGTLLAAERRANG